MSEIKRIFDEIAGESSTNKKMDLLGKYTDNTLLKDVLYLANSKRVKFYIKQIPEYPTPRGEMGLDSALDGLSALSTRKVTGHSAIGHLVHLLSSVTVDDAYILERIIEKDCKIGMGTSNINKIFKDLIEKTPYMGAISYDEEKVKKIFKDGSAYSQIKMDGRYSNAIIRGGETDLESRQGEPTILTGAKFLTELDTFSDMVLNGELTMGPNVSRYESNGIIASLIDIQSKRGERSDSETAKKVKNFEEKHMPFQEALDAIVFTVWDAISIDDYFNMKSNREYDFRFNMVIEAITLPYGNNGMSYTNVNFVETHEVDTIEGAMEHFQDALKRGEEGTILKSSKGLWKNGKPNWQIKMKLEMNVDLKIVGFNYGTGKNEALISSVNAETSDGKVFTKPTGINEDTMAFITENQDSLLGKIVEVKCSGLSSDSSGNYSLLHPVFKMIRDDKDIADSLEDVKSNEAMIKGLI